MNKNLNFIPNPGKPNKKDFKNDTENFYRRIMLRAHFGNEEPPPYEGYSNKNNSSWTPREVHHSVKTFIQAVNNDLLSPERENNHLIPPERGNDHLIPPERGNNHIVSPGRDNNVSSHGGKHNQRNRRKGP